MAAQILSVRSPGPGAMAGEYAHKNAMLGYRDHPPPPGPADARDFPGLRCTLFHKHC